MRALKRFFTRLANLTMGRQYEKRLKEEVEVHVALLTEENLRSGLSPVEARRQALLKFGGIEAIKEGCRDQQSLPFLETLLQDTRHALRRLHKTPAFTLTTTLTLALGIGATTSIFTLVHAVLLKSLPVSNPDQLYRLGKEPSCCIWGGFIRNKEFVLVSYDLYRYFRDHTHGFEEMAGFQADGTFLGVRRARSANAAESYFGKFISGNYFSMFGVSAYAGRRLTPADDRPSAPPAAIMSYRVWQQKYGLDPTVIGGVFNINEKPFTVVGITPPNFYGDKLSTLPPDFYLPLATEPLVKGQSSMINNADTGWLNIIGRVQRGVNVSAIEAQMRVELQQWLRSHWREMSANERLELPKQTLNLSSGGAGITSMRQQYEDWLQILMMVSGFVLLIVCANVANLMLVRGMERRQQTSLSMALGAQPMRVVRQALTESLVLSLLGGAAGLGLAFAGTSLILHLAFETATAVPISASPSVPVLLFALGVSLATGVIFGITPAWMATHVNPVDALRGANRATRNPGSIPRRTLVVFQAALSLVLLSASGLLTGALRNLEHQNFGFDREGRFVIFIDPVLAGYKPEQLDLLYRRIHDGFASIAGVASVACALYTPLSGDNWDEGIFLAGQPAPGPHTDAGASWVRVSPGYFETIGNPILKGRAINEQDTSSSRHVAVINEAFARKLFKNEDPIGKHFGKNGVKYAGEYEIVGVAMDARYLPDDLDKPVGAFFFVPESQSAQYDQPVAISTEVRSHYLHDIVVRMQPSATLPEGLARRTLASIDPNLPILRMQSLNEQVASTFSQQRLIARLTSLFGILALVLASIGVYGITAYNVGSRTNEIGVRVALGADRSNILALILRGALVLVAFGLLVGVPLTLAADRFLSHQLYGLNQYDPVILSVATLTLAISALVAALIPAFRATSISPMQALRIE
jgi:predicted permease